MTLEQLSDVLSKCNLKTLPNNFELRAMFAVCDREGDGTIDWKEWLSLVRPPLSQRRLEAVRDVWLREFGDARCGGVSPQEIAERYDAASHPDVVKGRTTAESQYRSFLESFDVEDDKATLADFEAYYANVGCTVVADDDFFAQLSVWRPRGPSSRKDHHLPTPLSKRIANKCEVTFSPVAADMLPATPKKSPKSHQRRQKDERRDVVGVEHLFLDIRRQLSRSGPRGMVGLARTFRMGPDKLNATEFKGAIRDASLQLTDSEIRLVFEAMKDDSSGRVDYNDFLGAVRGEMNARRMRVVRAAFDLLDDKNRGSVDPARLASAYDAAMHPDVQSGRRSRDDVYREFLETFDVGEDSGLVTIREFENYYANVSACTDEDEVFECILKCTWHLPGATKDLSYSPLRQARPKTFREVSQTLPAGGGSSSSVARHDRLSSQRKHNESRVFSSQISLGSRSPPSSTSRRQNFDVFYSSLGTDMREIPPAGRPMAEMGASSDASLSVGSLCVALKRRDAKSVVDRLQSRLASRGPRGFADYVGKLRELPWDATQFSKAMREVDVELEDAEISALFGAFDSYEQMLKAVRGDMNARRSRLVERVFESVVGKDSFVNVDVVVDKFRATKHPDVVSGKVTANQVLQDFLDTFEVGGEREGRASENEFFEYFRNLSATIHEDSAFESILRNCWRCEVDSVCSFEDVNRSAPATTLTSPHTPHKVPSNTFRTTLTLAHT